MTFEAMVQCQACRLQLIGFLVLTLCSNTQAGVESILNAGRDGGAIHPVGSGQQREFMGSRGDEFDAASASFRELDALMWHRFDEEVSVGLYDGASDEEISPGPSVGYSEDVSPGPSGGYFDEAVSPGPSVVSPEGNQRTQFDVRFQFGAAGDGISNDTDAFLAAWEMACTIKSGEVLVPSGYTFLVYPTTFSGPCEENLRFSIKGTIIAPMEISAWDGMNVGQWLVFQDLNNFTLSGGGTFNGRGQNWWACKRNETCQRAPNAVTIYKSSNVIARYVSFVDSAQMHINFQYVNGGHAKGLRIQAPWSSPNTDGIHISGTTDFTIQKCNVSTGDDCVSIVSGSHNIEVKDTYCGKGCHGISVGSLGAGGEHANVTQVQVKNCQLESTTNGLRVKTWQGGTGIAQNFEFRNIELTNVSNPIVVDQYYCPPSQIQEACVNQSDNVHISLVKFTNIYGTSTSSVAVKLACSESQPCTDVRLKDINITQVNGNPTKATCTDAFGMAYGTQLPPSCIFATNSPTSTLIMAH